jgi:hypothetical protein
MKTGQMWQIFAVFTFMKSPLLVFNFFLFLVGVFTADHKAERPTALSSKQEQSVITRGR